MYKPILYVFIDPLSIGRPILLKMKVDKKKKLIKPVGKIKSLKKRRVVSVTVWNDEKIRRADC